MPNGNSKFLRAVALVVPEIKDLLQSKNLATLKQFLRELHPLDLADSWESFEPEEQVQIFRLLSSAKAVKLFECIKLEQQRFLLMTLGDESANVIEGLPPPEVAKLFHKLPPRTVKKLSGLVKREESLQQIELLMQFPPQTAGSLMHPEFIKFLPQMTAKQALETLQAVARPHLGNHIYALYVTNGQGKLVGNLTLQDLLGAPSDAKLSELMASVEAIKVPATLDQEEVAKRFSKYNLTDAPVVDEDDKLIGILLADDLLDVIRQEASEDIAKMAGTGVEEFHVRSIFKTVRLRLPWLVATILGEFVVSLVVKSNEQTLQRIVALASFMPLIAAMGGNVGAQSATIVVRSIALGVLKPKDWKKAVGYEFTVGAVLGLTYGVVVGAFAYLLYGHTLGHIFSVVVVLGMFISMVVASTMGAIEPFVFQAFGIDPATATGPLITTTTDLISTSAYLTIAAFFIF